MNNQLTGDFISLIILRTRVSSKVIESTSTKDESTSKTITQELSLSLSLSSNVYPNEFPVESTATGLLR